MKYLICAIFAILAVISLAKAEANENLMAISKECQEEVHSTPEEIQKFFKNGMNPADASDAVKCHIKCVMEKRGNFKNGEFDEEVFIQNMQQIPSMKDRQDEIAKIVDDCKGEKGDNECETAYKITMCFKKNKLAEGWATKEN